MQPRVTFSEYLCIRRKFLLYNLILRNLKIRYRNSLLGMFWTVLIPAGTAMIYYTIFHFVFKVGIPNYLIFILSGLIPWTFFSQTVSVGVESLVGSHWLLNKVPLPVQALPLSETLSYFLNLLLSIPVLVVAMVIMRVSPSWTMLQYPVLIGFFLLITYPLALILSVLYVYFRDLKHLVALFLQLWFYVTPVMYSNAMIPEKYRIIVSLNPLGTIFSGFHASLVEKTWLTGNQWGVIVAWTLVLILFSKYLLSRLRTSIVEML